MSRIGKQQIKIPAGVKVAAKGNVFSFEGPKGKLSQALPKGVNAKIEGDHIIVTRDETVEGAPALHGLI
ncbi:MAG: 50S ribosomal protein L6, partial [Bdellovibrionota bacterium]